VSATCTPSLRILSIILIARQPSSDSGKGVSNLIFPGIQDSFTFDSWCGGSGELDCLLPRARHSRARVAGEAGRARTRNPAVFGAIVVSHAEIPGSRPASAGRAPE
jgi:hypothetical protein